MKFITGNQGKFEEMKLILPNLERLNLDLPEIQEMDQRKIIEAKLHAAKCEGAYIVEDTAIHFEALNGFPGPLFKWMLKSMSTKQIAETIIKLGNTKAQAKCIIGYKNNQDIHYFEGECNGTIVMPRNTSSFGWDPIFLYEGLNKTFSELTKEEKNQVSHRSIAANKLKAFLQ